MCHNHCSAMVLKIAPCVVLIHRKKKKSEMWQQKMFPYFIWKQRVDKEWLDFSRMPAYCWLSKLMTSALFIRLDWTCLFFAADAELWLGGVQRRGSHFV